MSVKASLVPAGVVVALATALVPLAAATRSLADVELRTRPNHARRAAFLDAAAPLRQTFRSGVDGLERIDVALSDPDGGIARGRVLLVLRDEHGEELRRASADLAGLARPFELVPFAFGPVEDSAGRRFTFELVPDGAETLPVVAWMRARRLPGVREPRGTVPHRSRVVEGELEAQWADLSAVAISCALLTPGTVRFELLAAPGDGDDPAEDAPLRVAEVVNAAPRRGGSVLVAFEPVRRSRAVVFRWRAEVPEGSVLLGGLREPGVTQYHGRERDDDRLLGATGTGWPDGAADVIFRSYGADAPLARLVERAGVRVALALVLWVAALAAVSGAVSLARASAGTPDGPRGDG